MSKLRNSSHEPSRSYSCRAPRRRTGAKTQIFLWQTTSRVLLGCRQTEEWMVMNKDTGKTKHLFHWLHVWCCRCSRILAVSLSIFTPILNQPVSGFSLNPLCPITAQTTDNRPKIFIDTGAHFFVDKLMHFIMSLGVGKSRTTGISHVVLHNLKSA